MSQRNNILSELQDLNSDLPAGLDGKLFAVPEGYFDALPSELLVKATSISPLSQHKTGTPFSVPEGYFDNLQTQILSKVRNETALDEIKQLSPVLAGISRSMPFSVPENYFDRDIKAPAKVVSFSRRPLLRYAAAAMITGLIAVSVIFLQNRTPSEKQIMAGIEKDVRKMDVKQMDSLADFIDAGLTGSETAQVTVEKKGEVEEMLKGISEEELQLFEQQNADLEDVLLTE